MFKIWTILLDELVKKGYRGAFFHWYCSSVASSSYFDRLYMERYIADYCDEFTANVLSESIAEITVDNLDVDNYNDFKFHVFGFLGSFAYKTNSEIFMRNYVQAVINSENKELINRFLDECQFELAYMLRTGNVNLQELNVVKQLEENLKKVSSNFEEWKNEESQAAADRVKRVLTSNNSYRFSEDKSKKR